MTYEEYIKELERRKLAGEKSMIHRLPEIEKQAYQLLLDYIDENLDTKDGNFVANEKAVAALQNFTDVYLAAVADLSDYKGSVGQFLKNFKSIGKLMAEFQQSQG